MGEDLSRITTSAQGEGHWFRLVVSARVKILVLMAVIQNVIAMPKDIPPEIMAQREKEAEEILAGQRRAIAWLPDAPDRGLLPRKRRYITANLPTRSTRVKWISRLCII